MDLRPKITNQVVVITEMITFHQTLHLLFLVLVKMAERGLLTTTGRMKLYLGKTIAVPHSSLILDKRASTSVEGIRCINDDHYCSVFSLGELQNVTVVRNLHLNTSQLQDYVLRIYCVLVVLVAIELNFRTNANKTRSAVVLKV